MWVIVNTVHGVKRSRTFSNENRLKIYRVNVTMLNRAKIILHKSSLITRLLHYMLYILVFFPEVPEFNANISLVLALHSRYNGHTFCTNINVFGILRMNCSKL